MRTLKIGVASFPEMKARTLAIASGTQKVARDEPKLWLSSLNGLAKVLSPANRRLLQIIKDEQPRSLAELSRMSNRAVSNLSRTLANMERYGLVHREKDESGQLRIRVQYDAVCVRVAVGDAGAGVAAADHAGGSGRLGFEEAVEVWKRWHRGEYAARIAAALDVKTAHIYDVVEGNMYPGSKVAAERKLGGHITRVPRRTVVSSPGRLRS